MNKKLIRNIALAVVILIVGLTVKNKLSGMATKVEIKEDKTAPMVNVFSASPDTVGLSLELYGKLNAVNRVDLLAEVSGSFVGGDRDFLEGTAFKKGEVMIQLDNAEAKANAMSLKGNFINSILGILPDIKMDYAEDYARFEAYYNGLSLSSTLPALPEAAGTLEKFLIARGIQSAYYQVKSAEERLAKFSIRAPFDGVVAVANVKRGNLVSPGRALGTFVGTGTFEIKSAVTLAYADELSVGQKVQFTSPDVAGNWTGTIDRISPVVDAASQSINVIANVRGRDLREGMYLTGAIKGVEVYDALSLPAYMVFDNEYVYTVENDSILQKTKIHVVEWLDDQIIITGIGPGTTMVDAPTLKAAAGTIVNATEIKKMKRLIEFFIKYPVGVDTLLIGFFFFGWISYNSLNTTFFPLVESRLITVTAVYPGASPEEIEEGVVNKIEQNLKGLTGVEQYTSVSSENAATIRIEVLKGYDTDLVLEDVKNAVERVPSFPTGLEPVRVSKQENLTLAMSMALSGEGVDLVSLKQEARRIERELRLKEGISKVTLGGYPDEEIEIALDKNTLRKYDLTLAQIANALRTTNLDITGGTIKGSQEEMLIRSRNKNYEAQELQNIIVYTRPNGQVIRLKDVGTVRDRWADNPTRASFNGIPSVEITVNNTDQEDLLATCEYLNDYINTYNASTGNMQLDVIRDFSVTLQQRKDLLFENGLLGFVLVLILLTLFLNMRLAFWVAIGIPVSFAGMFILANYFGITINVISLFGMIVVIGILVDDGIVIAENIYAHYEEGKPLLRAALDGTVEVIPSVVSAVLTTIIAFSSFFFLDGRAGDFFSEMSFIVIATLAVSLIEGLLFLPAHLSHSKLDRKAKMNPVQSAATGVLFRFRDKVYAPFLHWSLRNKLVTISLFISLMFITFGAIGGGIVRTQFFPFIERDNLDISLDMPAGTNEAITQQWIDHIEATVWKVNDQYKAERADGLDVVTAVQKNIGPSTSKARLNVILLDSETRLTPSFLIQNDIRKATGEIPGADNLSFGGAQAFGKPISVSLVSYDLEALRAAKEILKSKLKGMDALTDVVDNDQKGIREITLHLTDKARYLGLTPGSIMTQVRENFFGAQVQRLQRGEDEVKVWVRLDEKDRRELWDLEELLITTAQGEVPLRELATYTIERGTVNINHLDGQREFRVESDLSSPNGSAPALLSQIQADILPEIFAQYPSVSARYEGQQKQSAKTQESSKTVMPIILFLIILTITFTFRSLIQTIMIMLLIPLSLTGVAWGHWLHGMPMSILSFLGVVALIGIIVNDSLVLVSKYNINVKAGQPVYEAIYNAGLSRFRAIFLTTITTVAGLAPLIFETSFQAQFLIPMAVSIAYGIGFATMLTLVVLPSLMALVNDARVNITHLRRGVRPTREEVEPAIKEMKGEAYFNEIHKHENDEQ